MIEDPGVGHAYRALVLQSDDQYVLRSKEWTPDDGVAILPPRNDSVRLEFKRSGAAETAPTC